MSSKITIDGTPTVEKMSSKVTIDGFPIVTKMNEQFDAYVKVGVNDDKKSSGESFTKVLEKLYEPLNLFYEKKASNLTDAEDDSVKDFLNNSDLNDKETDVTKCLVLNIINRFTLLNTTFNLISNESSDLYNYVLSSNDFRIQLITRGAAVKIIDNKYVSYSLKKYIFPTKESSFSIDDQLDMNDCVTLGPVTDTSVAEEWGSKWIFTWPGCGFVLPKKYKIFTLFNTEILFPNFNIIPKQGNADEKDVISLHEKNWGVNVMQSDRLVSSSIAGGELKDVELLHKSFANTMEENDGKKLPPFFNIGLFMDAKFFDDKYDRILELPLSTPLQDILLKIADDSDGKGNNVKTPIIFSTCT